MLFVHYDGLLKLRIVFNILSWHTFCAGVYEIKTFQSSESIFLDTFFLTSLKKLGIKGDETQFCSFFLLQIVAFISVEKKHCPVVFFAGLLFVFKK